MSGSPPDLVAPTYAAVNRPLLAGYEDDPRDDGSEHRERSVDPPMCGVCMPVQRCWATRLSTRSVGGRACGGKERMGWMIGGRADRLTCTWVIWCLCGPRLLICLTAHLRIRSRYHDGVLAFSFAGLLLFWVVVFYVNNYTGKRSGLPVQQGRGLAVAMRGWVDDVHSCS